MGTFIVEHEVVIRSVFFFGVFAVMAVWGLFAPYRQLTTPKSLRWLTNLVLVFINRIMIQVIFPNGMFMTTVAGMASPNPVRVMAL